MKTLISATTTIAVLGVLNTSTAIAQSEKSFSPLMNLAPIMIGVNVLSDAQFDDDAVTGEDFSVIEIELRSIIGATSLNTGKLIFGADFRYTQYSFSSDNVDDSDLYQLSIPMTYISASDQWTHIIRIAPGIHSDFEEIDSEDFTATALYQATYTSSNTLKWVAGIGIGHEFGESSVFPLIGAIYQPGEKLLFNLVLPKLEMIYAIKENWSLHASLGPTGRSWNVVNETNEKDVDIVASEIRFSVGTSFAINNTLSIRGAVGSAMNRNLEFTLDDGSEADLDVEDSSFVSVAIEVRL